MKGLCKLIAIGTVVSVAWAATPIPTFAPTRFPTTSAPTSPPFFCSEECHIGLLSNGRCDSICDIAPCGYDGGECSSNHLPCNSVPWITCLNDTHTNELVPFRDQFFNGTLDPYSYFCDTVQNYYHSLANCTATYQCWNLFDDFMDWDGWSLDFISCHNEDDLVSILSGYCPSNVTCDNLLPGAPTSSPTFATQSPTYDIGPQFVPNPLLGGLLGGIIGLVVIVMLTLLFMLYCTKRGARIRVKKMEKQAAFLDKEMARLEQLESNPDHHSWKSTRGVRQIQLERYELKREQLEVDIRTVKERFFGTETGPIGSNSPMAIIPATYAMENLPVATLVGDIVHSTPDS